MKRKKKIRSALRRVYPFLQVTGILLAFTLASRLFDVILSKMPFVAINPTTPIDWEIDLFGFVVLVALFFWGVSRANPEAWEAIQKMLGVELTVEDDYYP